MKTLCPRPGNGGKIHPSPAEDPIAAAFRLLPAATLVLVAGLTPEDQRVLAHLVTRSFLVGWDAATAPPPEQARGGGRRRRGHPPTVGCLCFDCYSSFWTRWGCSPQHDRIHAALEAFEEHLNAAESAAASSSSSTPPSSKRRDKGKRFPSRLMQNVHRTILKKKIFEAGVTELGVLSYTEMTAPS
ncbi:hypothetical protein BAE44_0005401 [Dichanthelium oligosanthes]|uniref:Uncharacterized protein n=1 Tax=Dichanthelium oligosanthes TaxID=888268 RepID=A0A1E5W866_9POAL|nr:hypothetical protein BAE44_0005401 [Dichanthelium oligosanthes]